MKARSSTLSIEYIACILILERVIHKVEKDNVSLLFPCQELKSRRDGAAHKIK